MTAGETHTHTQTTYIRSLLMVRRATWMNFQDLIQAMQSPSPANRLQSQVRESNLAAPNTLRHAIIPLIRHIVLPVRGGGIQTVISHSQNNTKPYRAL